MIERQTFEFYLDLNPENNPFDKYFLVCNPFICDNTGKEHRRQLLKGLASGCSKADLPKFLGDQLGLSKEAVNTIIEHTTALKKYQVIVWWNSRTQHGGVKIKRVTEIPEAFLLTS